MTQLTHKQLDALMEYVEAKVQVVIDETLGRSGLDSSSIRLYNATQDLKDQLGVTN